MLKIDSKIDSKIDQKCQFINVENGVLKIVQI
jgi:hypothetical protein